MGIFTRPRTETPATPTVPAIPPQELLDLLNQRGQTLADLTAIASESPALTGIVQLADAIDQAGAYIAAGLLIAPGTDQGTQSLLTGLVLLGMAGHIAGDVISSLQETLQLQDA